MSGARAGSDGRGFFARAAHTPMRDAVRFRLSGRLDLRRLLAQSVLSPPLQTLVLRVVRRTRLWRIEKVDVAQELITHFSDGLASGAAPEKLALDFGDPEQAAALIRRAKKRGRPAWWHTLRYSSFAVLALIGTYALLILYYAAGRPNIATDYVALLNEQAASVAEEDRAWPLYRQALLAMEELPESLYRTWPEFNDETREEATAYARRNAEACRLAREAAARPALGYVIGYTIAPEDREIWPDFELSEDRNVSTVSVVEVVLPHLSGMRRLAQLLAAEAHIAAADGDGELFVSNVYAMLRIAANVREHPILINDLVAFAIVSITFNLLGEHLAERPELFSSAQLVELAHHISAIADDPQFRVQLEGERVFFADFIQRVYTDNGRGGGRWTPHGLLHFESMTSYGSAPTPLDDGPAIVAWAVAPAVGFVMANRRQMMAKYDEMFSHLVTESNTPLWRRTATDFDAMLNDMMNSPIERYRYMPIMLLMPAIGKASVNGELTAQRRDATLIAIALELYRREHGDWPASLASLTPQYLPAVPRDRFDGKPMRYTVRDGRPVVYSVGTNHEDNGGVAAIGRRGEPDPDEAMRWMSRERAELLRDRSQRTHYHTPVVPEGDWILWPRR